MDVAIYCRISEDREGAGLGVERQRADCEELAKQKGWRVVGTYVDNDISAYSGKKRPEYRRLLADAGAGKVGGIIAWHTDRLHRSPRELEEFIDVCEKERIRVETVRAGELDLRTPAGRAVARTLGAWARYESEHRSERIRRKVVELAQRGVPYGGGYRCFGYEKDKMTLVPVEAQAVREATERVLAGETLRSICIDFNNRGIKPVGGGIWGVTQLRKLLARPRLAGFIEHHTAGRVRAQWPAIITEDQQARLLALFNDPARLARRGAPYQYLLSGMLKCGECGHGLTGHQKGTAKKRVYICEPAEGRGCGKVAVSVHLIEPYMAEAVLVALDKLRVRPARIDGDDDASDLDALIRDKAQLEELASLYAARSITAAEWIRARSAIEDRISERNRRIGERTKDHRLRDLLRPDLDLRAMWPTFSIEQKRSVVRAVLDRVTVARATQHGSFDPGRLAPVWRV